MVALAAAAVASSTRRLPGPAVLLGVEMAAAAKRPHRPPVPRRTIATLGLAYS